MTVISWLSHNNVSALLDHIVATLRSLWLHLDH